MVLSRLLRRAVLRRARWRAARWRSLSSAPSSVKHHGESNKGLFQIPLLNDGAGGGRNGWALLADEGLAKAKSSVAAVGRIADELRSILSEIEQAAGTAETNQGSNNSSSSSERLSSLRTTATEKTISLLQNLDDVSNELCKVVDAAELCRNVHDSDAAKRGAEEAYMRISEFIQVLNVDRDLYRSLAMVCDEPELSRGLNEEQLRLATSLREDFESHGVHLSESDRQRAVSLQGEITRLGTVFSQTIVSARGAVALPLQSVIVQLPKEGSAEAEALLDAMDAVAAANKCKGINEEWRAGKGGGGGGVSSLLSAPSTAIVPTDQMATNSILKWARDADTRRRAYVAGNTIARSNLRILEALVSRRHELAKLLGHEDYCSYVLKGKMAPSREYIQTLLSSLSSKAAGKAEQEMKMIADAKRRFEGAASLPPQAWDTAFYMGLLKAQHLRLDSRRTSEYFSLGNCIRGLALICERLYGVRLVEAEMLPGESWAKADYEGGGSSGVRKLELLDTVTEDGEDRVIGTFYLDLEARPGKYTHNAHFTIRGGRADSLAGGEGYQLPLVALVCNFAPGSSGGGGGGGVEEALLSHSEFETLLHEFGHAVHSLLSRTRSQHLHGTRGPIDFVETPSHLMEYFAWDHRVLREFAVHHRTGEVIPADMVEDMRRSKTMFSAMETQSQALFAQYDLRLHSRSFVEEMKAMGVGQEIQAATEAAAAATAQGTGWFGFGGGASRGAGAMAAAAAAAGPVQAEFGGPTTTLLHSLQRELTNVPVAAGDEEGNGTYWQSRFGHLVGYGGAYYSYLYARVLAARIWAVAFEREPLSREAGERWRSTVLVHGGARDPHRMLQEMLAGSMVAGDGGGRGTGGAESVDTRSRVGQEDLVDSYLDEIGVLR